jgi:hypothetical protein
MPTPIILPNVSQDMRPLTAESAIPAIDFDNASQAWMANKRKKEGTFMMEYIASERQQTELTQRVPHYRRVFVVRSCEFNMKLEVAE